MVKKLFISALFLFATLTGAKAQYIIYNDTQNETEVGNLAIWQTIEMRQITALEAELATLKKDIAAYLKSIDELKKKEQDRLETDAEAFRDVKWYEIFSSNPIRDRLDYEVNAMNERAKTIKQAQNEKKKDLVDLDLLNQKIKNTTDRLNKYNKIVANTDGSSDGKNMISALDRMKTANQIIDDIYKDNIELYQAEILVQNRDVKKK